jgi:integrase/recombinase XerD
MPDATLAPSFSKLVQSFFAEHLVQQRALSPRTVAAYRDTFRLFLTFLEKTTGKPPTSIRLTDINAKLVLAFLAHLEKVRKNAARSRNARLAAIRSFLKYATHHDVSALLTIQQVMAIPMKRFDRPMLGFLSREEIQAILEAPDTRSWTGQRDRVLFAVLYNTGVRVSEIINVCAKDAILDTSPSIHILGKGRKQRTVPLWRSTVTQLRAWKRRLGAISPDAPLFPNRDGVRMTRSNVRQRLEAAIQVAAEKHPQLLKRVISPHTFRHTTAMHLLQSGVDITVIALWLGHESPATTHIYVEADLTMKERALGKLRAPKTKSVRYRPPDQLLQFLQNL